MPSLSYNEQVKRQLSFIANSCVTFDRGCVDEAIRLAVAIRVLAHDTKSSTSLLSRFNRPNLRLLSTCQVLPPGTVLAHGGLSCMTLARHGNVMTASHMPRFASPFAHECDHWLSWNDWWKRELLYVAPNVTRCSLVLSAANKDGGAHVDDKFTKEYESLRDGLWQPRNSEKEDEPGVPIGNVHLFDLRQMGFELLNSPDIIALAK
jgi:hypothetical protein